MTGDPVSEFIAAMEAAGVVPAEAIADRLGNDLIRFVCEGDRKGRRNGWAILHMDGVPAGAFGSYRLGVSEKWRSGSSRGLSRAERADLAQQFRQAKLRRDAEREQAHRETASACLTRWKAAGPVDASHPYLVRKRICGEGLRQDARWLLVPMRDANGDLWNLQAIDYDGRKLFTKGGRQKGLHFAVGDLGGSIAIGEGLSTMLTVRRATGWPVVVAFSAANLCDTALTIRAAYRDADIVIAADDDAHLIDHPQISRNLGVEAANNAARAVGGRVAMPPRKDSE